MTEFSFILILFILTFSSVLPFLGSYDEKAAAETEEQK